MTETKALILGFTGVMVAIVAAGLVLGAVNASGTAWGLVFTMLLALGAFLLSLIVTHYAPPDHRHR
jgi:hypothetical protein